MSNNVNENIKELASEGYPLTGEAREYALDEDAYMEQKAEMELQEFEQSIKRLGNILYGK